MRKRYSRSYTVLSFLTMFSYREQPFGRFFFCVQKPPAERAAFCRQKTAAPQMGRRCAFAGISELRINVLIELGAVQMILVGVAEALDGEAVVLGDLPVL